MIFRLLTASSSTSRKETTIFSSNQTTETPEKRMETEPTSMSIIRISMSKVANHSEQTTTLKNESEISSMTTSQISTSMNHSSEKTSNTSFTNQNLTTPMITTPNLTTLINATDMITMTPLINETGTSSVIVPN